MGNREGQRPLAPAAMDAEHRKYSLDVYLDELKRAQLCKSQKIITNSGPNDVENRERCFDFLVDFYVEFCKQAEGITIMIEPTDYDTSKWTSVALLEGEAFIVGDRFTYIVLDRYGAGDSCSVGIIGGFIGVTPGGKIVPEAPLNQ